MRSSIRLIIAQNRWGWAVLLITWAINFSRIISGKFVYFLNDLEIIYYPLEDVYQKFQLLWQLPQWSPLFGFGHPLIAWGQLGFFIPLHVLLRFFQLHAINVLQISILFYFAIGSLGFYSLLRQFNLKQLPAALGAVIFTYSGFSAGHLNHVNFYAATMLVPWALLAVSSLIDRPTLIRSAVVSLILATLVLSGQPQIVLYSIVLIAVAAVVLLGRKIVAIPANMRINYLKVILTLAVLAGVVALALSSFAILPLAEFLPFTERNDALRESELFDFSYAPWNTITLLFPTFFGAHHYYWGPKGFQELAGFIGIVPLLLAGLALSIWRNKSALRFLGCALIAISIVLGLGEYSPVYRYLVLQKIWTGLAVPGRFIFFFDTGIAMLAAIGLADIAAVIGSSLRRRIWAIVMAVSLPLALLIPFYWWAQNDLRAQLQLLEIYSPQHLPTLFLLLGTFSVLGALIMAKPRWKFQVQWILLVIVCATLLVYGWNFNTVKERPPALAASPFAQELLTYEKGGGIPARLYSRENLIVEQQQVQLRTTEAVSSKLALYQPISIYTKAPCFIVQMDIAHNANGWVKIGIHPEINSSALAYINLYVGGSERISDRRVCFDKLPVDVGQEYVLSFSSETDSGVSLAYLPLIEEKSAYFVRVQNPTADQLMQSHKAARLAVAEDLTKIVDVERILMVRHLQATANSSSARWIGSLSVWPYREFIDNFFANDQDPFHKGIHVIEDNRQLVNFAGITHLIQKITPQTVDRMEVAGFKLIDEQIVADERFRLYENPDAFEKAFVVPNAKFVPPRDETRVLISDPNYDARKLVFINGPEPPLELIEHADEKFEAQADIVLYKPTELEIKVKTPHEAWLVVTDSTTPQWRTFIDGRESPYFVANTIFKTARVPAGDHLVRFEYHSPAVEKSKIYTIVGLIAIGLMLVPYHKLRLLN